MMGKSHRVKDGSFSLGDFSLDVRVELLEADGLVVVATHSVNDVQELSLRVAVVQLVINFLHVFEVDLSLSLIVDEVEGVSAALFREGISLN
jgi:hypothetical protein